MSEKVANLNEIIQIKFDNNYYTFKVVGVIDENIYSKDYFYILFNKSCILLAIMS